MFSVIKSKVKSVKRMLKQTLFMWFVSVAVASYLSQDPLQCLYPCPYRFIINPIMRVINFFFCMILSCSISCSDLNGSVVDCVGDDDVGSFI
jgi:hypothetical protein